MQIAMLAIGTRGDVQPMIALAKGLQAAGHTVSLLAGSNFHDWIESHGIISRPFDLNIQTLMQSEKGQAWTANRNPNREIWLMKAMMDEAAPPVLGDVWQGCQDADLLITGFIAEPYGISLAEKLQIPQVSVLLQPIRPTRAGYAHSNTFSPGETILNRWMGNLVEFVIWQMAKHTDSILRRDYLNLPPQTVHGYRRALAQLPSLYAFSPLIVSRPHDLPPHIDITGYLTLTEKSDWTPSDDLLHFLDSGPPPVYIGFGSMSTRDPQRLTELAVESLLRTGQRGIIARGWAGLDSDHLPESIYLLDAAPHDWLFPRCAAVIHHGGSGTTAAGLHAGVPAMIVPFIADQPFWGTRLAATGVGLPPITPDDLTIRNLSDAITRLVHDVPMRQRARDLAAQLAQEDGITQAVQRIEAIIG